MPVAEEVPENTLLEALRPANPPPVGSGKTDVELDAVVAAPHEPVGLGAGVSAEPAVGDHTAVAAPKHVAKGAAKAKGKAGVAPKAKGAATAKGKAGVAPKAKGAAKAKGEACVAAKAKGAAKAKVVVGKAKPKAKGKAKGGAVPFSTSSSSSSGSSSD